MAGLGLVLTWSGYMLAVWGYSKIKSAYTGNGLSIADLALPSHRVAYLNAMTAYQAGGTTSVVPNTTGPNTVGLPAGSSTLSVAIAQAKQDVATACAGSQGNSVACANAKKRLSNIQSQPGG